VAGSEQAPEVPADAEAAKLVRFRADLPALELAKASKRAGDESTGPTLSLWIKHLTPDFTIDAAQADETSSDENPGDETRDDETMAAEQVRSDVGAPHTAAPVFRPLAVGAEVRDGAKITRAEPDGELGLRIDLEFPSLQPAAWRRYRIAVVDGFGSRTPTLEVRQVGSDIEGNLHACLPAIAAPVDESVAVPRTELLTFAEAARQARDAGLVPVVRSTAGEAYIDVKSDDTRLVVAQGVPGGRRVRRGELLLLALEGKADGLAIADSSISRRAFGRVATAGDPFGFVAVPERRSMAHAGFEATDDDAQEDAAQIAGAHAPAVAPVADDAAPAEDAVCFLPVADGAWVPLDPRLDPAAVEGRASMKAIVEAVSSRLGGEDSPGAAGRLLGDAIREFEDDLAGSAAKPGGLETAVGAITDQVAERLNVNLSADERSRLIAACTAANAGLVPGDFTGGLPDAGGILNGGPLNGPESELDALRQQLDRNGNGFAADDLVAWILAQLLSGNQLPSNALGQVVPGALGTPVAVLPTKPNQPSAGGKPAEPTLTVVNDEIKIPAGKPTETAETSPTKVRVPPLDEARMLPDYLARLEAVGLSAAKEGKFFAKDKVLAAEPAAKEWVAPTTPIKLQLERLVPDVTNLPAQEAVAALHDKDFKAGLADPDRRYRNDDRVVGQSPENGAYRPPSTKIDLSIKRPVPKITGLKLSEAVPLLRSLEFKILIPETRLETDVVAEQSPAAGTPADINSEVTLVRLETTMHDLAGASIAQAKTLKQAQEILGERLLKYSIAEPTTNYAQAKVIAQYPKFGAKIDREKVTAEMKLVIPVPEVRDPVTLAKAIGSLQTFTLTYAVTTSKAQDDDYVMDLDVAQGEKRFASGGKTYVYPGAKVVLTVGRPVPQADRSEWTTGLAAVRDRGFDVSTPLGTGTHVFSTEPVGGKLADLRYPVRVRAGIKVPAVDGMSWDAARRTLADVELGLQASSTTDVETDNSSLFNTLQVADDAGQSPPAGRIILKGSVRDVSVRALRYVERRAIVPDVVGLDPSEAGRRVVRAELLEQFTRFDQPTSDERLAGTEQVASQEPAAGTRLKKGSKVFLRVRKYVYQAPLTTYAYRRHTEEGVALALAAEENRTETANTTAPRILTCVLSADRTSVTVTTERTDGQGGVQTARGTLIDDETEFQGKRCFTYSIDFPRRRWGLRIPYDGIGGGQSLEDGQWVHAARGMNPLRFDLQKPTFK
jgi:beta-lactam-binding protein with PASTA domain